ncbi:MAG: nucleotidyltransferase domain-containing protein [Clostridia bacterium]|nr:nucleotidyltransferase domain-containing protein [Clostridia bacterium]
MRYEAELRKAAEHVRLLGYQPAYIALHGSQNYGLALDLPEYRSDYDFKCMVIPSLWSLAAEEKPVSRTVEYEDGQIDIRDIRLFAQSAAKCSLTALESLMTENAMILVGEKEIQQMRALVRELLRQQPERFAKACRGGFYDKEKKLCHPFPAAMEKIRAYGYDGKQAHHMYRLLLMMRGFEANENMRLMPPEEEAALLLDLKLGKISLRDVRGMIEKWKREMECLYQKVCVRHPERTDEDGADVEIVRLARQAVYEHIMNACKLDGNGL